MLQPSLVEHFPRLHAQVDVHFALRDRQPKLVLLLLGPFVRDQTLRFLGSFNFAALPFSNFRTSFDTRVNPLNCPKVFCSDF